MKKRSDTEISEQSISTKNIFQRINAVMKEVEYVLKETKTINGQYRFVSHDAVTAKLHGPLTKHGIIMLPSIVELINENIMVTDKSGSKHATRSTVKIEVSFVNMDKPEDKFSVFYYGCGIDPGDKGIGKAISYAVKYALLKTFCLETGEDPERDIYEEEIPSQPARDYVKELGLFQNTVLESCSANEKTTMVGYLEALEAHYKKKGNGWEEHFLAVLTKMNGKIKERALEWALDQVKA